MSTSISSLGSSAVYRPSASQMASNLFSKLDTKNQGYIENTDLQTALKQVASDSSDISVSTEDIFNLFDSDSDGKITKDEMTSGFEKLAAELDSQFNQSRVAAGGMPPLPPPSNEETDTGFTQDELTAQLEEIGTSDSKRASLISNIVENFDEADTNGDGKVSFQEAIAYDQSTSDTSSTTASASSSANSENIMRTIKQLIQAYGTQAQDTIQSNLFSQIA